MKKTLIISIIIIFTVVILPVVGNIYLQSKIEFEVNKLAENGLESKNSDTQSGYLTTKKHFEFLVKDSDVFMTYLKQFSNQEAPVYVENIVDGMLVGVDLEYCNIPFLKSFGIEIYPLAVSEELAVNMQESDKEFLQYIEKFLQDKSLLYHINYNMLSEDFVGFLKDINENHPLKDGVSIALKVKDATFNGNGKLIAPQRFDSKIKEFQFSVEKEQESVSVKLENLTTSLLYKSKDNYLSRASFENFAILTTGTESDLVMDINGFLASSSFNATGESTKLNLKSSLEKINFQSDTLTFMVQKVDAELALSKLDKNSLDKLEKVLSSSSTQVVDEQKLQKSFVELLSKGLIFDSINFSIKNITHNKTENLKGLNIQSKLELKADSSFEQKMQISPMLLLSDIDLKANIKLSKEIYAKLTKKRDVSGVIAEYLKEDKENILLDISFMNGEMKLNNRVIQ